MLNFINRGPKIVSGSTWDECMLRIEEERDVHPFLDFTVPVRGADGRFYSQIRYRRSA